MLVLEEDAAVVLAAHLVELALRDDTVDEEAHLVRASAGAGAGAGAGVKVRVRVVGGTVRVRVRVRVVDVV